MAPFTTFQRNLVAVFSFVWFAFVVAGFVIWQWKELVPGSVGYTPEITHTKHQTPSVEIFIHPHCSCTRFSLPDFFEQIRTHTSNADVHIHVVRPAGVDEGWERSSTWDILSHHPNVKMDIDQGGVLARSMGAETSGFAIATDIYGHVQFRGGFARRGTSGIYAGMKALIDVLNQKTPEVHEASVYGCSLLSQ